MLALRQNNFRNGKVADGAIAVVIVVDRLQDGVRESVVRHRNAIQRADNILRRRPMMVVEGLGAGHATEREQQHPRGQLSKSFAHCGGKSTIFSVVEFMVLFLPKIATSWDSHLVENMHFCSVLGAAAFLPQKGHQEWRHSYKPTE